jgi:hypothetical protein
MVEADTPQVPDALLYLWEWFCEIASRRTSGGMAVNPITFVDVYAWAALTRCHPEPWEVRVLLRLDDTFRHHIQQAAKVKAG